MLKDTKDNIAVKILRHAERHQYGVPGLVVYNLETAVAAVRAAERKNSPCQLLLFPWSLDYAGDILVNLVSDVCRNAKVPMSLHLDHAQSAEHIRKAADTGKFDSIMVDFSHHEKPENLRRTKELVDYCHARGISTEAEPGRINGGEAGVADTGDLESVLTTPEEALEFIDTGIDFLAPAIGNIHGDYFGVDNIKLDYDRLDGIRKVSQGKVTLVLHGTNEFTEEILQKCVKAGMTRINVNKLVLEDYENFCKENQGKLPLTEFMEKASDVIQKRLEWLMDAVGSTGKAAGIQL